MRALRLALTAVLITVFLAAPAAAEPADAGSSIWEAVEAFFAELGDTIRGLLFDDPSTAEEDDGLPNMGPTIHPGG